MKLEILERTEVNPDTENLHRCKYPDHWERYEFASNFLVGKKIIDVACGPGYGTTLLAKRIGNKVYGLDINETTVTIAQSNYGQWCNFIHINGYSWPFESDSMDVVVSLETFEHLDNPGLFIEEVNRVLKSGGILILSTPLNESLTRFKPDNKFHFREYNWDELGEFITKHFNIVERYSQISRIGELNALVDKSPVVYIKNLIPSSVRKMIINCIVKTNLKSGNIKKGKIHNASVQIVIAKK